MSDSVRPHRRQPTRLPRPWDSPGKNTGVGCHFLLQCMKVKSESEVAQSCLTLATPWTAAFQAPPPMGFSRQEYWSGVPLVNVNPWKRGQTWGTGLTGAQQSDEELASNLSVTRSLKTWSDWLTDHPNLGRPPIYLTSQCERLHQSR